MIPMPRGFVAEGDYASTIGWAVAGATAWAIGHGPTGVPELVRIDLDRRVATAFPIVAPVGRDGYLGGGIAPRLVPFLTDGRLVRAFTDKGRLKPVLERMPVAVILDPRTGLWGAAFYALAHPMTNGS